jgi:sialate O-acetylesterase
LIDGLSDEDQLEQLYRQEVAAWKNSINEKDPGYQDGWYKSDFDDAQWKTMEQPTEWAKTELEDYDGIVWFRRSTNLPPSWAKNDLELRLGRIDDMGAVWVNGVELDAPSKRVYSIPASLLHVGKNSIAVRIIDNGGNGGFRDKPDNMRIGPVGADADVCATVAGTWKYNAARAVRIPRPPANPKKVGSNTPTTLYNGMVAPLVPYRIAGVIWYQGESNCYDPILYRTLFPAMITDWRTQWDQGDFPFYYVQIAPFEYDILGDNDISQAIREAQMMTLDAVDNVGMAVTLDIGEEKDIHPKNKADVGDRLARWALTKTYGKKGIAYSGPIYESMDIEDGKIRIKFDYADDGLVAAEDGLKDFMIAGADKQFVPAKAVIDSDTVLVFSDEIKEPVTVRYGWSNWVVGSLFNKAGLPASSFRTDDWPLQ